MKLIQKSYDICEMWPKKWEWRLKNIEYESKDYKENKVTSF